MHRSARLLVATTIALAIVVAAFGGLAAAAPSQDSDAAVTTTATTITIRSGDSLIGLANRHGIRLSALLRANGLQLTSAIHPGASLVIPAGATMAATSAATTAPTNNSTPNSAHAPGVYVIQPGDALSVIAWRHGVSLTALIEANAMSLTSLILPGQRLRIPPATRPIPSVAPSRSTVTASSPSTPAPANAPTVTANSTSMQTMLTYVVAQVGKPYKFFSAGPDAFDCSGLVVAGFRQVGQSVPHQSRELAKLGNAVNWHSTPIAAGDLVFTSSVGDPNVITHVGIALDARRWVHAVGTGRSVIIAGLPANDRIMAVRRVALP